MSSLQNKTALVTGAGKGIGRAIALALAAEGTSIGLLARTEKDLQDVAAEARKKGVRAVIGTADISDITQVNKAVSQILAELEHIDILINNAGIGSFGKFLDLDPAEWEKIIRVNLLGTYYVTRAVLPGMITRKAGDIINISSTAGQKGSAQTSAYSASKFGIMGMTESLMQEVRKHNIRVSALAPSTVATDLAIGLQLTDGNPDKVMQPEDIAELVVAQLQLNPRIFIKEFSVWSTNP